MSAGPSAQIAFRPSRFVLLTDRDGVRFAVARAAISALRETEEGETMLLMSGGRVMALAEGLEAVLIQLE